MKIIAEMTIGELEKRSGIPRSTIHYYLWHGLLPQPMRTGRTMAYYDQNHLQILKSIQRIKMDYLKSVKKSRCPLGFIKQRLADRHALMKDRGAGKSSSKKLTGGICEHKREEIIKATLKLYIDRGYYLTNIKDIAAAVGISAPTFYYYFQDKRELFVEVIEYVVRIWGEEFKDTVNREKDMRLRIASMARVFYKYYSQIGEIISQLRAGVTIGDEWARKRLSKVYGIMTDNIAREISAGIQSGLIREVDPKLLGFFNIMINETAMHRASLNDDYTLDQINLFVLDMLFHAFLTEKGKNVFGTLNEYFRENPLSCSL